MVTNILRYSVFDLLRSRWSYFYFFFYLLLSFVLLFLNNDPGKAVITLLNVIVILTPMIGTLFGIMYFYNSREFAELLMAQPVKRTSIFLGLYLGLSISLSLSMCLGLGIPFMIYGIQGSGIWKVFVMLLLSGILLTFIFIAIAFIVGLRNENRIKGFGFAVLIWLSLVVIYDGIILILLLNLSAYPIEKLAMILTALNPIDLARVSIMLQLDISALMGYTGAVFEKTLGSWVGMAVSIGLMLIWTIVPIVLITRTARKKDF